MTLEDLLQVDASKIEALSNEELTKLCEPFFNVCRPELAARPVKSPRLASTSTSSSYDREHREKVNKGLNIAKQFGFDLSI